MRADEVELDEEDREPPIDGDDDDDEEEEGMNFHWVQISIPCAV